jgi:hypothetical protein
LSNHNVNAGAYRTDTGLSATFDLPPPPIFALFSIRNIRLDFYCRSFRLKIAQVGGGFPPFIRVAYSLEALIGGVGRDAGFHTLFPADEPLRRFFLGEEEGPPYIWLANDSSSTARVLFEYFPSAKRTGRHPMPTRRDLDFPEIEVTDATVVPGI